MSLRVTVRDTTLQGCVCCGEGGGVIRLVRSLCAGCECTEAHSRASLC